MRPTDWYLDGNDPEAGHLLRREVAAYLGRHATPGANLSAAELVVAELIGNAVRHASGPVWVALTWTGAQPELSVADLGPGFSLEAHLPDDPLSEGGRGMFLVSSVADDVAVAARRGGGAVVRAVLPLERAAAVSIAPPRRRGDVLPSLEEALPGGGFGREAFLRALVVQLARVVEEQSGPDRAEAAVAQVGTDVGGQMEAEYRVAMGVLSRLTAEELADCLVRLKQAIGGAFHVVEVSDDRIVLATESCPFGDVVRRAPALCRMTSSVFGGIAARNSPAGAAVLLEERIAVGDPGCRVVVWLDQRHADVPAAAHRYPPPE